MTEYGFKYEYAKGYGKGYGKPSVEGNWVWKRTESSVWSSGHSYVTPLPRRLLRSLGLYGDLSQFTVVWFMLRDGSIHVKLRRPDGSIVQAPKIEED